VKLLKIVWKWGYRALAVIGAATVVAVGNALMP